MPIKNLEKVRRLPRQGKIRLGFMKVSPKSKKEYPSEAGYFLIDPSGEGAEETKAEFARLYGPEPRSIDIMFPVNDPEVFFSQWYKIYKKYGKGSILICKGDGETAIRLKDGEGMVDQPCKGDDCEDYICKNCRRVASLQVLLPKMPGIGVWQINTTSRNSIINLNSSVDYVTALCGRAAMIPLTLKLIKEDVQMPNSKDGPKMSQHWIMHIDAKNIRLEDIQRAALIPATRVALPAPDEDRDDLLSPAVEDKPELKEPMSVEEASLAQDTKENVAEAEKEIIDKEPEKKQEKKPTKNNGILLNRIDEYRKELNDDKMFYNILGAGFGCEQPEELSLKDRAEFTTRIARTIKDLQAND